MILGFAFQLHNVSTRALYSLKNIDARSLLWGRASIERFVARIEDLKPANILGFGIGSNRATEHATIELACDNRFRREFVGHPALTSLEIKPFISPEADYLVTGKSMGTSYCNLVSYSVMELIIRKKLPTRFTFIHIPGKMPREVFSKVTERIDTQLAVVRESL